jgi:hypothetical protein
MADYYPLISHAIGALDKPSGEARRALYDRVRATLAEQVRRVDPPFSETDLEHERLALEDAIRKVDADATLSEAKWPTLETQSSEGSNSQQTQPADDLKQVAPTTVVRNGGAKMRRRLGDVLLLASLFIADVWIWFAVERLRVRLEEWQKVYVVAGVIVLIGLALRYFLAGKRRSDLA